MSLEAHLAHDFYRPRLMFGARIQELHCDNTVDSTSLGAIAKRGITPSRICAPPLRSVEWHLATASYCVLAAIRNVSAEASSANQQHRTDLPLFLGLAKSAMENKVRTSAVDSPVPAISFGTPELVHALVNWAPWSMTLAQYLQGRVTFSTRHGFIISIYRSSFMK